MSSGGALAHTTSLRDREFLTVYARWACRYAAVIEDGYGPGQRLTSGTLSDIADKAAEADVKPPAVVVIGDVVRQS